jgi:hypothetical protein
MADIAKPMTVRKGLSMIISSMTMAGRIQVGVGSHLGFLEHTACDRHHVNSAMQKTAEYYR